MSRKLIKPTLALLVLALTIGAFVHFIAGHPSALQQLRHVRAGTVILLLVLYTLSLGCLALAQEGTLELVRTRLGYTEAFLLVSYTSLVNFFGPLQSGPGFRALYLKRKYGTKLKNYALATLLYLGFYAAFSGLFLISGLISWNWLILIALAGALLCIGVVRSKLPFASRFAALRLRGSFKLGLATFAQVAILALIYFVELRSVNSGVRLSQAIIYAGAANFALFVSVTPGAIGFRESFLVFSKHLHHIDNTTIVNASLLDRGVYVLFLGLLFIIVLATHARARLKMNTNA